MYAGACFCVISTLFGFKLAKHPLFGYAMYAGK
jgi:hypothetical protein